MTKELGLDSLASRIRRLGETAKRRTHSVEDTGFSGSPDLVRGQASQRMILKNTRPIQLRLTGYLIAFDICDRLKTYPSRSMVD